MDRGALKKLIYEVLSHNASLFLVKVSLQRNNRIAVVIDGDHGVSIGECVRVSKHLQLRLDQEGENFELEVSSPDISHPLTVKRQYFKNLNRILKVKTADQTFEGTLTSANESVISLGWKVREPKPIGKGKVTVERSIALAYDDIKEAKVKITF